MSQFKDKNARVWTVAIDAPKIAIIRKLFSVDLGDVKGSAYEQLAADVCLLVDVLYELCRKEAEAHNVSSEQFGEALVGDPIDSATAAILEAMKDFFPLPKRELLTAIIGTNEQQREIGVRTALAKIGDPELMKKVAKQIEKNADEAVLKALTQLSSATSSPDSAGSAPTD